MNETILVPPEPPPLDFAGRHAHLLAEITRPGTRKRRPVGFVALRRIAVVAGLLLAITGVGTAIAVGARPGDLDVFSRFFDEKTNNPRAPRLVGDRAVIARDDDWAFVAWKSTRGLCTSLVFSESEGGTSCGVPVVGATPDAPGSEHLIDGGLYQRRPGDEFWLNGVGAAQVSRVEIELVDGRRQEAPVYDAPAQLGLDLKFFLLRTPPPSDGAPTGAFPELPVRAFSAYDADGRLLERLAVPQPR